MGERPRGGGVLASLGRAWPRVEPVLHAAWCAAVAGYVAGIFHESMMVQTGGDWSAPLDDVFIHFDYARAAARGWPLQWSEGNGVSSGNTSVLYPFVLAIGWWGGLRDASLMAWSFVVAFISVVAFLWVSSRLLEPLGRFARYLVPPAVLSLGALSWSLWSGMENAFHLGVWAVTLALLVRAERRVQAPEPLARAAWATGAVGAALVLVRPESVTSLLVAGLWLAVLVRPALGVRAAFLAALRIGLPAMVVLVAQAVLNRVTTGEWSQAGAIAKLAINHPYMTAEDKWNDWTFHLRYVLGRNVHHHFADAIPWGWIVPALAVVPLAHRAVRRYALLLWGCVAGWVLIVSLNGQVRWQNERYTMAAVAWLLVLAAMGLGVLLAEATSPRRPALRHGLHGLRAVIGLAAAALYVVHQAPNFRDQVWFFGRACRNIRDQHLVAGGVLKRVAPRRVLVGDAGALIFAADRPGLDLIGLGGYHDFPFARAGRHGLGASLELVEHMPPEERPDVMAIYPSWWGDLPGLFGEYLTEVPVAGNVICGGASKVIYRASWAPMERKAFPRSMLPGERVVAELDVADLMSERAADYTFPGPGRGYVVFRVLPDPRDATRDLFDAGRIVPPGAVERAELLMPRSAGRVVLRTTGVARSRTVKIRIDGAEVGAIELPPGAGWVEGGLAIEGREGGKATIEIEPIEHEVIDHHLWVLSSP